MTQQFSPFVESLMDYVECDTSYPLILHNTYGEPEEMSVEVFFREQDDLSDIEKMALHSCRGEILDLGAGAGALSLILQDMGKSVTALESDGGCSQLMQALGVKSVIHDDFWKHTGQYDTVLAMMNGLGLAGTLDRVPKFLEKCLRLLKPDGQLIFDSSDISYLYAGEAEDKAFDYYGEVRYRYEYKGQTDDWFDWVYVDQDTLFSICKQLKLNFEILHTDEYQQYLGRISN
ncbi:MAG: class I SAM-dependent methyltransferase [Cytophagales bacterium]|nr:class I SAM-dependent methyltransferase [Cytophagales bacterium]